MSGEADKTNRAGPAAAIASLGHLLTALDPKGRKPAPREVAELLWLAGLSGPTPIPPAYTRDRRTPTRMGSASAASTNVSDGSPAAETVPSSKPQPLFLAPTTSSSKNADAFQRAATVRIRRPDMIGQRRELIRALRPLKRRVPSPVRLLLDEDATASRNAERRHWIPVFFPAPDRWLDVTLVVDALSECAAFWEPLGRDLQTLLQQLGAFRDVRLRYLHDQDGETVGLSSAPTAAPRMLRSPDTALNPTGRTVVLVLTDGVAPAWRTTQLRKTLHRWAVSGPTAILQALPEYTWEKTALAPTQVRFHSLEAGGPNSHLLFQEYGLLARTPGRRDVAIPVLEVGPEWLGPWAQAIAGSGAFDGQAVILHGSRRVFDDGTTGLAGLSGSAVVERTVSVEDFRASVQPGVYRLAAFLAAAPLNLSVMRTVQSALLPNSPSSDLAEVIFSGLLRKMPTSTGADALSQDYDFIPGARERLLGSLRTGEADDVIATVSTYVDRYAPAVGARFTAVVQDPHGPIALSAGARHWAEVHDLVRRRQGRPTIRPAEPLVQAGDTSGTSPFVHATRAQDAVTPPPEVIAAGATAIEAFRRDCAAGTTRVWRSRLLVLGEAAVGKTSLIRQLIGRTHDPEEPQTHGLHVDTLELTHPTDPGTAMELSVWDFGGQSEYQATHLLYVSDRALFLVVWNARARWRDGKLHDWLDTITARAPESPILLVATHHDDHAATLPNELRERYPKIAGVHAVDVRSGHGISELRETLRQHSAALPHMGVSWPNSWINAATRIRTLKGHPVVPAAQAWRAMAAEGVTDVDSQHALARCMHELGDLVFFADEPTLNSTVILRPQWLDAHVTAVLDSTAVAEARGLLTRAECGRLWGDLTQDLRDQLVQIMELLGIAFRIGDGEHGQDVALVVELVGHDRPAGVDQLWQRALDDPDAREIGFNFTLRSRQAGVLARFTTRQHRHSTGLHWAQGVLLRDRDPDNLAYALVVDDDRAQPTISIHVRGRRPARMLSVLVETFRDMTGSRYPGLVQYESVACLCQQPPAPLCGHAFTLTELTAQLEDPDPNVERKVRCPVTFRELEAWTMLESLNGSAISDLLDRINADVPRRQNASQPHLSSPQAGTSEAPQRADSKVLLASDDLDLENIESLEDLGNSLRRLRRRSARRRRDALVSYRHLAEKTGYAHGVIGGYFSGKVLPPPDKLNTLTELLGATADERREFAQARDVIEQRRNRPATAQPSQASDHRAEDGPERISPETSAASGFLYELLTRSGKYRALWRAKIMPGRGAHEAIADVIAEYLRARFPDEPSTDADQMRHQVAQALARGGPETRLTGAILEQFIGAFDIEREDADRLRFLYTGSPSVRYVRGDIDNDKLPILDAAERNYRTLELREYHYLGPDGLPSAHRTVQTIEALADGVDHASYLADSGMLTVDVQSGGTLGPAHQIRASDGNIYPVLDIQLDRTLRRGDTAVLNYTTTFSYAEPPETLVRRGFRQSVDSFLLVVQFHPDMVPTSLWWAEWDGIAGGQITHREKVRLSLDLEAHRHLQSGVAQAIVGFCWEW